MTWIKSFLEKIGKYFQCESPLEDRGENLLCVFLRRDSDYLFLEETSYKPLLFKVDILTTVAENESKISKYLFDSFEIAPYKIRVHMDILSLKPVVSKTLSFATVDLTDGEFEELKKNFIVVSLPQISLYADTNIFFNILTRIILAGS